ncbi:hypothetical protein NE237_018474 [Protea cynaroides]|uniref:CRAL-TRIO domain-containing protein n=1 Tax=Protea cynaroides TaxID=273540 RepID=A0A9Q0QNZ1_9MAGN|nr:hypothetical protein NE237_018474 [Protea cynaroides]
MTAEVNSEETQVVEVLVSQPEVVETVKVVEGDVDAKKEEKPIKEIEEKGQPVKEEEEGKLDEKKEEEKPAQSEGEAEEKPSKGVPEKEKSVAAEEGEEVEEAEEVNVDISLWGVPLLPSKGAEGTDVILLKFLRARDFKVNDAFEMLMNTLQWRKEFKIDSILDEDLGSDLNSVAYMNGVDRKGHPVCYNIYGLMEEGIQKLDFKQGGVSSILQFTDLKNSPGPSKKELRISTKQAVGLLQDNYPEFVPRNIFINVPFWYYAFNAVLSPFLTHRTKSKFVFARSSKVAETLLKYIPAENIPIQFGGLKRENDSEFSVEDGIVSELLVKNGGKETVEIPVPKIGSTAIWDLTVLGWEVSYKK